jgi:putative transposase
MPRKARLDAPGVLHHIIIRGIERHKIFRDDKDKDDFMKRLATLLSETRTICYAWALMSNHAHFLFRSSNTGLSALMRRLLTGYAIYFNHRYNRHGQLFQNRYKSIICQEDIYFKELIRYIHLNPLRAKLVPDIKGLSKYPYSGHSILMGMKQIDWYDSEYVFSYFGQKAPEARKRYFQYIKEGVYQGRKPELVGGGLIRSLGGWSAARKLRLKGQDRIKGDERILGEGEFVSGLLSEAKEKLNRRYELKCLGYDFEKVIQRVSLLYNIGVDKLFVRGRRKSQVEARDLLCFWAVSELGMSCTDVARRLGMSQPGVGYAVNRGKNITVKNNYLLQE